MIASTVIVGCSTKKQDDLNAVQEDSLHINLSPGSDAPSNEFQNMSREEQKELQEYNMDLIRSGLPSLPIPLTPEQDKQLVEEGILPPLEE